MGQFPFYCCKL